MSQEITRDELRQKIERGDRFILAEVLAPDVYAKGHLPGAVNLPPERVRELASSLLPDKNTEIVTYCGSPL